MNTNGQAFPLSRVSWIIEGNITKYINALGLDEHGNIDTSKARYCAENILADRLYWIEQQGIEGRFLPLNGQYVELSEGLSPNPGTLRYKATHMLMNGILQQPNTGWLITAAKAFAGFPGHLLGPANDEVLKIIFKYVSKDKIQVYKGRMGGFRTLQQFKSRLQNKAFLGREDIQRCLNLSLENGFHDTFSFNLVRMNIEVNIAVWETSTGTPYGGHDQIIGNQFAQVQFKIVKKGFRGSNDV